MKIVIANRKPGFLIMIMIVTAELLNHAIRTSLGFLKKDQPQFTTTDELKQVMHI